MPTNMVKHSHTKFQDSQHKIAQSKTLITSQSTVGAKWSFDSQKSKFLGTTHMKHVSLIKSLLTYFLSEEVT